MNLDRYNLEECSGDGGDCKAKLVKCKDGDWVAFDDVVAFLDELVKQMGLAIEPDA